MTEEILGLADNYSHESNIQDDEMLGRARVAQVSFAEDASFEHGPAGTATPEERYAQLRDLVASYLSPGEIKLLDRAYKVATKAHVGQCRKSGEPFIMHPIEVCLILVDLRMDIETLCAAMLHDTVEDCDVTLQDLTKEFNEQIATLVDGVTKINKIKVGSLSEEQAQTFRKMFVAMSKDIRVIVIKLADRLHNMRTLMSLPEDRRIYKARETLEVYAPIANRLGIESVKWELEDLAFYFLEPNKYKQVARMVMESRSERETYINGAIVELREELKRAGIKSQIAGRPKHLYSIYRKMTEGGKGFSELYDILAVRVIVENLSDCYGALGAVHTLWRPIPGRFKDYIAMPKANLYQSLHTTVIGPAARPLEVQIRTEEMHRTSEYGVAAHWRYKEKNAKVNADFEENLAWLREAIDWQDETRDPREFLNALRVDLSQSEVFVFTPKGEVMSLRSGSTPVDFAYAIHTEVGNHCVGAKVNGMIVPLTYQLQSGDRIEILTQKSATPSRDWLTQVKTPSARSKIRNYFSKITRSDDLEFGREKLMREMRKHSMGISSAQAQRAIKKVSEHMGYNNPEDMLVQIGLNKESPQHVANRLLKMLVDNANEDTALPSFGMGETATGKMPPMITSVNRPKRHEAHTSNGIVVKGLNDVLVRLSRCCNPVPGDEIIGFVTRGRGVSVHRKDCPNAKALQETPERIIDVEWEKETSSTFSYKFEVVVEAIDRMNLLRDVTAVLAETGANIISSNTTTHSDGMVDMRFLFQVSDLSHTDDILANLRGVEGVFEASRMQPGSDNISSKHKGHAR